MSSSLTEKRLMNSVKNFSGVRASFLPTSPKIKPWEGPSEIIPALWEVSIGFGSCVRNKVGKSNFRPNLNKAQLDSQPSQSPSSQGRAAMLCLSFSSSSILRGELSHFDATSIRVKASLTIIMPTHLVPCRVTRYTISEAFARIDTKVILKLVNRLRYRLRWRRSSSAFLARD